ncbi:MAG: CvpA family protein [Flavisolibacter sp.]
MLIDIIAFLLLLLSLWKGIRKGLVVAVFSFLAFIIGLAAAIKLSAAAAVYIGNSVNISQRWLPVLAFLVIFFLVVLLVKLGARLIEGALQMAMLGWLNRLGGVFFYFLMYIFIFSILLFYANQLHLIRPATTASSLVYPYVEPMAPKILNGLGYLLPVFRNMFDQLLHFFQNVSPGKQALQISPFGLAQGLSRLA